VFNQSAVGDRVEARALKLLRWHCRSEPERVYDAQRSGGNLRPEGIKKVVQRSIAPSISPVERLSRGSRMV
jgi:hypothetical protein